MLSIISGNPQRKAATHTRFVLPFSYLLKPAKADCTAVCYAPEIPPEQRPPEQSWRERYLTPETAEVLFRRAAWFRLGCGAEDALQGSLELRSGRTLRAMLNRPELVLFEFLKIDENPGSDRLRTGFLVLELYFPEDQEPPRLDDLLEVNELFRYWREPYAGHAEDGGNGPGKHYRRFLADFPFGVSGARGKDAAGDKIYTSRWEKYLEIPVRTDTGQCWWLIPEAPVPADEEWRVHADDRAYVWTCALLKNGGNTLRSLFDPIPPAGHSREPMQATGYGHWIKLLNVDSPGDTPQGTHSTRKFERDWADRHTYQRWEEYGTFYGFTPHSGAMLSSPIEEPPLWQHFRQMYFDQILLLLYVRTTLFRFSEELTRISAKARDLGSNQDAWRKDFERLRWDFALFTNLYQFPLLSNQQQAVEMYGLAREAMDIEELFGEVQSEIHGSHEYLVMLNEQRQAEMATLLTVVATFGLALGLASGILGMNTLIEEGKRELGSWFLTVAVFLGCLGLTGVGIVFSKRLAKFFKAGTELPEKCRPHRRKSP